MVYNTAGIYDVTLTATNAQGSDSEIKPRYITVVPASSYCFAAGKYGTGGDWINRVTIGTIDNSS